MAYTGTATIGAILLSQGSGIPPIWSSPLTNGQILIGNTGHIPTAATISAGTGISVTNAAGSITITNTSPGTPITVTQYDVLVGGAANTIGSVGPGTAGQILRSGGAAANPAYSTTTYPATNAINTLLYASAANVMSALATATTAVLTTAAGVPTWASELSLALGGTNADLTASNGGIFYSSASAGAILSGTATAKQMLQSGASTTPAWSTTTWPATTAINTLLYSSAASVISALATANNGVLLTSGTGVPSIGNATVAVGGTGNTTFTAYSIICAGTTATGSFQNVVGVGSAGNILRSAGASALPAWTTTTWPATTAINTLLYSSAASVISALATADNGVLITSSTGVPSILADGTTGQVLTATTGSPPAWANAPAPSSLVGSQADFVDDFFYGNGTISNGTLFGTWLAGFSGTLASVTSQGDAVQGSINLNTGDTTTGYVGISQVGYLTSNTIQLGQGIFKITFYFNPQSLSVSGIRYNLYLGLSDTGIIPANINGIWLAYSDNVNSGNWTYNTEALGTQTNSNSSVAFATGNQVAQIIVNAAASSVNFLVGTTTANLTSIGTITTHIPSNACPFFYVICSSGTSQRSFLIDCISYNTALTTAR